MIEITLFPKFIDIRIVKLWIFSRCLASADGNVARFEWWPLFNGWCMFKSSRFGWCWKNDYEEFRKTLHYKQVIVQHFIPFFFSINEKTLIDIFRSYFQSSIWIVLSCSLVYTATSQRRFHQIPWHNQFHEWCVDRNELASIAMGARSNAIITYELIPAIPL